MSRCFVVQDALCPVMAKAGWNSSGTQGRLPGVNSRRQLIVSGALLLTLMAEF